MIFEEQISRKPDKYPWTKQFIRAMQDGLWTDREFSFSSDKQDFKVKLTDQEKETIVRTLSAIAQIEVAVKTFWAKLGDNLPHPSIVDMGYVFSYIEVVHNFSYQRLLEELNLSDIFEKNLELKWIKGRVDYLKKYNKKCYKDEKKQFTYALILFTLFVENVSLFSQFYTISWFGRKNLLKDTNQMVAYTMKEEDIHAKAGIKLINQIREEHPEIFDENLEKRIIEEAQNAFNSECEIIDWMANGIDTEFLSADILKEFVKNRINESLKAIGYNKPFRANKEKIEKTEWFNELSLGNEMADFFHSRSVNYSKNSQNFSEESLF